MPVSCSNCKNSNGIAVIGLTICFDIGSFQVLLGHLGSVERLHYQNVVHGHRYDSGAKTRSIFMMPAIEKSTAAREVQQGENQVNSASAAIR